MTGKPGELQTPTLLDIAAGPKATDLVGLSDRWAAMRQGATVAPLPVDIRGSVQSTAATSSLARAASYDVWGAPTGSNTDEPQLGYRGELHLDTLVFLRARDYNPNAGEFTSPDPVDGENGTPVVSNRFQYADNNPLTRADPLGRRTTDADLNEAGCASVGGVQYDSTNHVCYRPPLVRSDGLPCRPPRTPDGKHLVVWDTERGCGYWTITHPWCGVLKNRDCVSWGDQYPAVVVGLVLVFAVATAGAGAAAMPNQDPTASDVVVEEESIPLSGRLQAAASFGDKAIQNALKVPSEEGYYDVIGHGTPTDVSGMSAMELATRISESPGWNGQDVRLLSCSTACPTGTYAQDLSNYLGVAVKAPTTIIYVSGRGGIKFDPGGTWQLFTPDE